MEEKYSLRCSVFGHTNDIRTVAASYVPEGGFVSGSRDRSIKVWRPNGSDPGFSEVHYMTGPSHYISCACALPPSTQYPNGLILAGSNDCAIYGFSLESHKPVLKLLGHSENVCALVAGNFGTVISGSWDKTARVWFGQKCVMTLSGHQEAVWAVALFPEHSLVLTGSADKEIRLWRTGKCERIFVGHEDCVRGLAVISSVEFISCSNDCTIRRWETSGDCIGVYSGHTDYIYDIAILPSGDQFVSCSEDQTVKIWQNGICQQTIKIPTKSLWSVTCLKNSDIVVGGSDGIVRVFTNHDSLKASPNELTAFKLELEQFETSHSAQQRSIGDLNFDQVPTSEVLENLGTYDGQNQLVREGSEVFAHQWSVSEQKWIKIGSVYDATENKDSKNKTMYEGKEYDYVFTIDVAEGKFLKLPYNVTENPWLTAQNFIEKHNLNQIFLDQIASFIITNSKIDATEYDHKAGNIGKFSDPFTGDNRYIPGNKNTNSISMPSIQSLEESQLNSTQGTFALEMETKNTYFPQLHYVTFDAFNIDGIKTKLVEFNKYGDKEQMLSAEEIDSLVLLSTLPSVVTDQQMGTLEKIVSWPQGYVFPALDLFRVAVKGRTVNSKVAEVGGITLINHLLKFLSNGNPVSNLMLTLRALCNFFLHTPGETLLVKHMKKVLDVAKQCSLSKHKHVQIALATLYLNYSVTFHKFPNSEYSSFCALEAVQSLFVMTEPEAFYRLLVCVGTAIQDLNTKSDLQTLDLANSLKSVIEGFEQPKIKACGQYLINSFH